MLAANRRLFSINGKNVLIRGGGWSPDMMLREDPQRLRDDFRYVQDMGLNTIRLEGKLETKEFFDLADERGILLIAGWCCCDHWEHWANWKAQDFTIAEQSLRDQIYRLRGHPSLIAWMNGSDNPPPPDVEQTYLKVEKELLWTNPVVSSATAKLAGFSGESGVKMSGPYEYVAPSYWQTDSVDSTHPQQCNQGGCGGAYGFNTETSMGPAVPPIESIRAMVGKDHLWPIDNVWDYHAGGGAFKDLHVFTDALNARFGPATSAEDYALKSQLQTYEGVRAMYEAYSRNKYTSTGVIQWMLNNAWPSMIWHLYDFYLRPGGGYFGAKRAMEPLHPVYGYDDHSVWLVSSQYVDAKGLKLTAKVLNLDMSEKFSKEVSLDAAADSTSKILTLPDIDGLSPTYFLVLRLQDSSGKLVGSNFYWLSTKPETLDWEKSNWYTTPTSSYADYTALSQLPKVKLKVADHTERKGEEAITHVTLENPSKSLAFFVRLKVNKGKGGDEILPGDLAGQLHFSAARRKARDHGQLSSPGTGSGPAGGRGQRLERGVIYGLPDFRIVELKSSLERCSFGFKFDNSSIRQFENYLVRPSFGNGSFMLSRASSLLFRRHIEIHQVALEASRLPRSVGDPRDHPDGSRDQRQV